VPGSNTAQKKQGYPGVLLQQDGIAPGSINQVLIYCHILTAVVPFQIQMSAQYFTPVHCTIFLLLT